MNTGTAKKIESSITILFDEQGTLLRTSDPSLSTTFQNKLYSTFPFVSSILNALTSLKKGEKLVFECVNTVHEQLPGIYDYVFSKTTSSVFEWTILDCTDYYTQRRSAQQIYQDKVIANELAQLARGK